MILYDVGVILMYCRKCGNKLLDDSLFCEKCGTKQIAMPQQGNDTAAGNAYANLANANSVNAKPANINPAPAHKSSNKKLIIALAIIGGVIVLGVSVALSILLIKKASKKNSFTWEGDKKYENSEGYNDGNSDDDNGGFFGNVDSQDDYLAKFNEILLEEQKKYGDFHIEDVGWCFELKGVCYINLIDIDQDGTDEMLLVHTDDNSGCYMNYVLEVWRYDHKKAECLYSGNGDISGVEGIAIQVFEINGVRSVVVKKDAFENNDLYTIKDGKWTLYDSATLDEFKYESPGKSSLRGMMGDLLFCDSMNYGSSESSDNAAWKSSMEDKYNEMCLILGGNYDNGNPFVPGKYEYSVSGKTVKLHVNIDDYISGNTIDMVRLGTDLGYKNGFYTYTTDWTNEDTNEHKTYQSTTYLRAYYDGFQATLHNHTTEELNRPYEGSHEIPSLEVEFYPYSYKGVTFLSDEKVYLARWVNDDISNSNLTVINNIDDEAVEFRVTRDQAILYAYALEYYSGKYGSDNFGHDVFDGLGYTVDEKDDYYVFYDLY